MSYDFGEFQRKANALSGEHARKIDAAEQAGETLATAEAEYHSELAMAVGRFKAEHGSTVAETLAKGELPVRETKEARDIAEAKVKAAWRRVNLAEADRALLLTMGSWSKSREGWEQ